MRLEWLEDILAVAETGSFTEAAERRHLTQSAFSRRIQQIEDYVGVQLFDRRSKPVQLRATTESQRKQIIFLIKELRQLVVDLKQGAKTSENQVIIATQHGLTATVIPTIINHTQLRDPNTSIKIRSANLDEALTMLLSRGADIALLYRLPGDEHPVRSDFVETMVIGNDSLIPVINRNRQAWLRQHIEKNQLPLITYPEDIFLGRIIEKEISCKLREQFQLLLKAETELTFAALEMAASGFAIAWIPLALAHEQIADGLLLDLSDELPKVELEITAVRLVGKSSLPQEAMWLHFKSLFIYHTSKSDHNDRLPPP